jgi:hypothetical protein
MFAFAWGCNGKSAEPPATDAGETFPSVASDISPPLRDLVKNAKVRDPDEAPEMEPVRRIPLRHFRTLTATDRVVQSDFGTQPIPAPAVNFEGMGAGMAGFTPGGVPPDTDGDIGPNHYVQIVNISMTVFSRAGQKMMGPVDTSAVWTGFNGACAQTNDGDATVRYDHIADRWVISQFSIESPFYQCVAVSTTPDPTGSYARYQFMLEALNDYPKIALWPDAYYFTFNMFPDTGFAGGKVCAMDRAKMLAGNANASMQCFDAGSNYGGLLASDVDGKTAPPVGAPNYIVALDTDTDLAYWKLHVDFTTPANSTFTGPTSVAVSSFSPLCGGGTCVPEPGGGSQLDSLADRAMNRFVYRRFADHETLLFSHSVTAGGGGGIRFYELRTPATPTVFQQGTFAPDASYRWMPSVAMDGSGDIAAIYTVSSSTLSPSIKYTARTPSDPPGTFGQGEGTIVAGAGSQTGISRWGDYASLNIDPVDDCTFWGTHEYKKTAGRSNWQTRVASFTLPSCSAFAVNAPDSETVAQGGTMTYTINTTTTAGTPQSLTLTTTGLPTGVTATLSPTSVTSGGTTTVTLTADATAMVGDTHYTLSAAGTASSQMIDIPLTVTPTVQDDAGAGGGDDGGGNGGSKSGGCCETGGSPAAPMILGLGVLVAIRRRRR